MQGKKEFKQRIYYNINLDSLIPEDHLLKRLEKLVSFNFVRDITRDCYTCLNGKLLKRKSKNYSHNRIDYKSDNKDCSICPIRGKCISGKGDFKRIELIINKL